MKDILNSLVIPTVLAVLGFLGKSVYEIYLDNRKKKIQILEERLKNFYWPLLFRIEKDNAIWDKILSKREVENSIEYKIGKQVEEDVLKNHLGALEIIEKYMYLAEADSDLIQEIKKYIRNISIYVAIRKAGEDKKFPMDFGAEWPQNLYKLLETRTNYYQNKLNKLTMNKTSTK